ncbi:MAG: phage holin family protein [Phycisphaerales bacterium]|nr:phage holin family protein [Phycisphaerales bacterium]
MPAPGMAELFRQLVADLAALVRQELRLARTEIAEKSRGAARNTVSIAVGGAVTVLGLLALLGAAVTGVWALLTAAGLGNEISVWLAPLLVGGVVAVIGCAMIRRGLRALRRTPIAPEKTAQSLKETVRWVHAKMT